MTAQRINGSSAGLSKALGDAVDAALPKLKRGRVAKPKLKRFVILEVVATVEAESEEAAREVLPQGRKFEIRELEASGVRP